MMFVVGSGVWANEAGGNVGSASGARRRGACCAGMSSVPPLVARHYLVNFTTNDFDAPHFHDVKMRGVEVVCGEKNFS